MKFIYFFSMLLMFLGTSTVKAQKDCSCPMTQFNNIYFDQPDQTRKCKLTINWTAPADVANPKYNVYVFLSGYLGEGQIVAHEITETTFVEYLPVGFTAFWYVETVCEDGGTSYPLFTPIFECDEDPAAVKEGAQETISVYPNPASSVVSISGEDIVKVEIFNSLGQLVKIESGHVKSINVSSFEEGIYLFKLSDFYGNTINQRVVIAR